MPIAANRAKRSFLETRLMVVLDWALAVGSFKSLDTTRGAEVPHYEPLC
jgi:hypothetical protein